MTDNKEDSPVKHLIFDKNIVDDCVEGSPQSLARPRLRVLKSTSIGASMIAAGAYPYKPRPRTALEFSAAKVDSE